MNTALIVAAGTSSRTHTRLSKVLVPIAGKPLFMHSMDTFLDLGFDVILVVSKQDLKHFEAYRTPHVKIVIGGETRSESVMLGLKEVQTPYVYIHDAARPLIHRNIILEIEKKLAYVDAVVVCEKLSQALKRKQGNAMASVSRDDYLLAQTPQAFLTEKIRYAHIRNTAAFDDDIALYQAFYQEDNIHVILNDKPNIKVTYPEDLVMVKSLLEGDSIMRVGHSFDIHPLKASRPMILGGTPIPFEAGPDGHSDADVLFHAIGEAILGAMGLGDLGTHFPDTDHQYKGISSTILIKKIIERMKDEGYEIENVDSTVYLELPKLNPYIPDIKKNVAKWLELDEHRVNIKATTYEKMDAIGKREAIASEAVVLLRKRNYDY